MRRQYLKLGGSILKLSIPIIILIIVYIFLDPFKVVFKYDSYYQSGKPSYVSLNKDYVSTETFLKNYKKLKYDSFIFGSSRSMFYQIDEWKKNCSAENCFHFDASGECLLGIYNKIKLIQIKGLKINNAIIALDSGILNRTTEKSGHLTLFHPSTSNRTWIEFEFEYFKTFISKDFFLLYFDFRFSHKVKDYMKKNLILNDVPLEYNNKTNEVQFKFYDDMIKNNPNMYYTPPRLKKFYKRDSAQHFTQRVIFDKQYNMLKEIAEIFKKDKTNYKIVINPLYDQKKINSEDLNILKNIFNSNSIYDFSGKNSFTESVYNYYETAHYLPQVATRILQLIYQK